MEHQIALSVTIMVICVGFSVFALYVYITTKQEYKQAKEKHDKNWTFKEPKDRNTEDLTIGQRRVYEHYKND